METIIDASASNDKKSPDERSRHAKERSREFETFEDFWPHYLGEHRDARNRALHYVGTSMALAVAGTALLVGRKRLLLLAPVVGYGPAWFGHFVLEKNRPATFAHPLWSLRGDLRMLRMAISGEIAAELERCQARGWR
jgi:hypothetical protein